jgi:alpha-mannosidase
MEHVNELIFLMPGYELEGYPRDLDSDSAARLLSGWVALWHPGLLCGVGKIPRWHQVSRLPSQLENLIFVLPPISRDGLESCAAERIEAAGGLLLQPTPHWREFQQQLLAQVPGVPPNELAAGMAEQFAALGYGYLQVQLMTRQLRYTSNLDVALFEEQVLRACEAVMGNDESAASTWLQACFDTLGQERDHYYSNDGHLIDLTLIAETTLGRSLLRQLEDTQETSLIASAELLSRIRSRNEAGWQILLRRLESGSLCLVGGLECEGPMPLAPRESNVRALYRAPVAYQELGVRPPKVFSRLSHGMQPDLPALLTRFNFAGAILIAFTGGRYPTGSQPKISWEAHDGCRLPAIATQALDAADSASFLALGWSLGEALDRQNVPTLVFAHWPGASCDYYRLLQILASRTPALGKWRLVDDYFETTDSPYHHQRLDAEAFVYDWLAESRSPGDLILTTKLVHKLQSRARCLQNLANLVWQLQNRKEKLAWIANESGDLSPPTYHAPAMKAWESKLEQFLVAMDHMLETMERPVERYRELQQAAQQISQSYLEQLKSLLLRPQGSHPGRLLLNPRSNPVRVGVRTAKDETLDQAAEWHFATGQVGDVRVTSVDLPAMGFVASPLQKQSTGKSENLVLADAAGMLKNEFLEAQIDLHRGHVRSLHVPSVRGNRLSVQVAYRSRTGNKTEHTEMVARQVSMLTCSNMSGIIRSSGHLYLGKKPMAAFEIDYQIQRGSRWLAVKVTLSDLQFPDSASQAAGNGGEGKSYNPWHSAYVLRWAWPTEAAILRTFPEGRQTPWTGRQSIAPDLIEIDEASYKTYILTGGLAFHRREDLRFAETILATQGQSTVRHRIGLAVDLPYPVSSARQFMDKPYELAVDRVGASQSGWLLNVDSKNVLVDLDSPLLDSEGKTVGLRALVSEMAGKSTTAKIRWFRDVGQANRVNFLGGKMTRLVTQGDEITIALRAHEQACVDLLWQA